MIKIGIDYIHPYGILVFSRQSLHIHGGPVTVYISHQAQILHIAEVEDFRDRSKAMKTLYKRCAGTARSRPRCSDVASRTPITHYLTSLAIWDSAPSTASYLYVRAKPLPLHAGNPFAAGEPRVPHDVYANFLKPAPVLDHQQTASAHRRVMP